MNQFTVNLVTAFGRGETLALALHENGFEVKVLDFTAAFAPEYQRGHGPFPVVDKEFLPAQREALKYVDRLPQGLTFWMKDGPIELTGPQSGVHIHSHPEIQLWKTNSASTEFGRSWLQQFLRQWTSPYHVDNWTRVNDQAFPAELPVGVVTYEKAPDFSNLRGKKIEVIACDGIKDVQVNGSRIVSVEAEGQAAEPLHAEQWVWCLSSNETLGFGEAAARKLFGRNIPTPEWAWVSFGGSMMKGPWVAGMPRAFVLLGDVYLPWCYGNLSIIQRGEDTRFRAWVKVPRARVTDIDARRAWASDVQKLLLARLQLAGWKLDSADWNLCPHSEVYDGQARGSRITQWKNQYLVTPEVLPRLDLSARLEREQDVFAKLGAWRDQVKKQGARRDHALHAP